MCERSFVLTLQLRTVTIHTVYCSCHGLFTEIKKNHIHGAWCLDDHNKRRLSYQHASQTSSHDQKLTEFRFTKLIQVRYVRKK